MTLPAGLLFNDGSISTSTNAVSTIYAGLGLDSSGNLVTLSDNPLWSPNGTSAVTNGALSTIAYGSHTPPIQAFNGVNWDALGRLIVISPGTAVPPLQQSNGFLFDANGAMLAGDLWPGNSAPVGLPTITGTPTENQTLTGSTAGITDADGLGTFTYSWLRDGLPISGATSLTYSLVTADVGATIRFRASYTDGAGKPEVVTSLPTAAVLANQTVYQSGVYQSGVYV